MRIPGDRAVGRFLSGRLCWESRSLFSVRSLGSGR